MDIISPLIANLQPTIAIEPGQGPLHHPTMAAQAGGHVQNAVDVQLRRSADQHDIPGQRGRKLHLHRMGIT